MAAPMITKSLLVIFGSDLSCGDRESTAHVEPLHLLITRCRRYATFFTGQHSGPPTNGRGPTVALRTELLQRSFVNRSDASERSRTRSSRSSSLGLFQGRSRNGRRSGRPTFGLAVRVSQGLVAVVFTMKLPALAIVVAQPDRALGCT